MTERRNSNFFEVLVGQIRQDNKVDVILGKPSSVLLEAELLKPRQKFYHMHRLIVAPREGALRT